MIFALLALAQEPSLDELEAKFLAMKPFHATYELVADLPDAEDKHGVVELTLDRAAEQAYLSMIADGKESRILLSADGTLRIWSDDARFRTDLDALMNLLLGPARRALDDLKETLGNAGFTDLPEHPEHLNIALSTHGPEGAGREGTFSFRVGRAGRAASWFGDARRLDGATTEADASAVTIRNEAHTFVIDREFGLLREQTCRAADGSVRTIKLTKLEHPIAFPEVALPDGPWKPLPINPSDVKSRLAGLMMAFPGLIGYCAERWSGIVEKGVDRDVLGQLTAWAADVANVTEELVLREIARSARTEEAFEEAAKAAEDRRARAVEESMDGFRRAVEALRGSENADPAFLDAIGKALAADEVGRVRLERPTKPDLRAIYRHELERARP